ncbi:MAG: hypothetical protein HRT90_11085 [Candidatus Margulisbacteria bacterium]|nr:hypothetical protein [Candidatus Margulisiibacteriota bacterium]
MITITVSEFKIISTPDISCLQIEKYVQDIEILELGIKSFTGVVLDGLLIKNGTAYYTDDSTYNGEFKNGIKNGHGIHTTYDKQSRIIKCYEGQWNSGIQEGYGNLKIIAYGNGDISEDIYSGKWERNAKKLVSGTHVSILKSRKGPERILYRYLKEKIIPGQNDYYESFAEEASSSAGYHASIALSAKSSQLNSNGTLLREPDITHDIPVNTNDLNGCHSVKGFRIPSLNMNSYTGMLYNGKPWGNGEANYFNGSVYTGQFRYGEKHGLGVFVDISSDGGTKTYKGEFEEGKRQGHGVFTRRDAYNKLVMEYGGQWIHGKKSGLGILLSVCRSEKNGTNKKYYRFRSGQWAKGKLHGHAVFIGHKRRVKNGDLENTSKLSKNYYRKSFQGKWKDGKQIESTRYNKPSQLLAKLLVKLFAKLLAKSYSEKAQEDCKVAENMAKKAI